MTQLLLGIVLGMSLTAGVTWGFGAAEFNEQIRRDQERASARQERDAQELFRQEQRQYTPFRTPC